MPQRNRDSPLHIPHDRFESEVAEELRRNGYLVTSQPYHKTVEENVESVIKRSFTPTSLYVRARADRFAINPDGSFSFQWEAKTGDQKNAAIEALPLAFHKLLNDHFGIHCLYIYKNTATGDESSFWVDSSMPFLDRIIIPNRWSASVRRYFHNVFHLSFPGTRIDMPDRAMGGSGDPFCLLSAKTLKMCGSRWREEISRVNSAAA